MVYLVSVIACKNNRHWGKINWLWNVWKGLQNGLHAWLALGGWGGFPQQQGVVGHHGAEVVLKGHRGGSTAWVPLTSTLKQIGRLIFCLLRHRVDTSRVPSQLINKSYCSLFNEWRSYLWIVDSRMLSGDCEDHHSQKLDQVFSGGEGFWETCWWEYSQQLAIKHV